MVTVLLLCYGFVIICDFLFRLLLGLCWLYCCLVRFWLRALFLDLFAYMVVGVCYVINFGLGSLIVFDCVCLLD